MTRYVDPWRGHGEPLPRFEIMRRTLDLVVPLLDDAARLLTLFAPQNEKRASWTANRGSADSEVDPTRPLVDLYDAIRYCDPDAFPALLLR